VNANDSMRLGKLSLPRRGHVHARALGQWIQIHPFTRLITSHLETVCFYIQNTVKFYTWWLVKFERGARMRLNLVRKRWGWAFTVAAQHCLYMIVIKASHSKWTANMPVPFAEASSPKQDSFRAK